MFKSKAPTIDALYTGGKTKTPALAIYHNIALFNLAGLINRLLGNKYETDKKKLEAVIDQFISPSSRYDDHLYIKLRNNLWKGYTDDKNSSGTSISEEHKSIIKQLTAKLKYIRNYHSHIWHDNAVLEFNEQLYQFVMNCHNTALDAQRVSLPTEVEKYEQDIMKHPLFKPFENKWYITVDGRIFLLSLFLSRGEMSRLLRQCKGYKRDDKAEFKIKHRVYMHFTHRDAATRNHYGFEETMLDTMPQSTKDEVFNRRKAYKIITYLNDVPQDITDPALFPLYFAPDKPCQVASDYCTYIKQHGLFPNLLFRPALKIDKEDENNDKELDRRLWIVYNGSCFELSCNTMHSLLLDAIRKPTITILEMSDTSRPDLFTERPIPFAQAIEEKLNQFIAERNELVDLLANWEESKLPPEESEKRIGDFYSYKIRNQGKARRLLGAWSDKRNADNAQKVIEELDNTVIDLRYHDFYYENDQKLRADDAFVRFAVQFFMDNNLTKGWEWQALSYELTEQATKTSTAATYKHGVEYFESIPQTHRLLIHQQQVTLRYKGQLFTLGHRAIKNLLIAHFDNKQTSNFFEQILADLNAVKKAYKALDTNLPFTDKSVLCANTIPPFISRMFTNKASDEKQVASTITKRIDFVIEQLNKALSNKQHIKRADKNRQIMRCYKLYDWKYEEQSAYKFLRKSEYQRMSIMHYCLDKKDARALRHCYVQLIQSSESNIESHLPSQIIDLLRSSWSFDDLFERTLNAAIGILGQWKQELSRGNYTKLDVYISRMGFSAALRGATAEVQAKNIELIDKGLCFDVHPILVLRRFYKKEMESSNGTFSLSRQLRQDTKLASALRQENYDYQTYIDAHPLTKACKRKIIDAMQQQYTQDVLLYQIAQVYLKLCDTRYVELLHSNNLTKVQNLRKSTYHIPITNNDLNKDGNSQTAAYISVLHHQLDDYMFIESKQELVAAFKQLAQQTSTTQAGLPCVSYTEVRQEVQRVHQSSLHWADCLFEWERKVVTFISASYKEGLRMQPLARGFAHINFKAVCNEARLDEAMATRLDIIRNHVFHAAIPNGWSYAQMEQDPALNALLRITELRVEKKNYES